MKKDTVTRNYLQGLLMAGVAAATMSIPGAAIAQDLAQSVTVVHTGLLNIPNIVAGLFYIGGAALIGAGALKLKAHAEQPVQNPLGHGLGRIGAGAALIALPAFGQWLNNTLAIGSNPATSQTLGTIQ
ncbi:MAG TPA: hypothetical protein VMV79_00300 [Alphaproteobacteria bacterium]|nr:hypothetical protein [Alphaproteobacteria bacterium]